MPLPGQLSNPSQTAPTTPTSGKAPVLGFHKTEFELPRAGWHNAVLAERLFRLIENDGRFSAADRGKMDSKIILCFELEQTRRDGKPFVFTLEMFSGVTGAKSPIVKFCKGWSGEGKDLTDAQWQEWAAYITGPDGPESDTNAPCIGGNLRLKLELTTSKNGRDYMKLAEGGVEPPDDAHLANPLKVSEHYKKWDIVQAEFKNRQNRVPGSASNAQPLDTSKGDIPF